MSKQIAVHMTLIIYLSIRPSIYLSYLIYLCLYNPLLDLGRYFRFLILYIVGRTPWTGDQSAARSLPTHKTTQTQKNAQRHPCLEWDSNHIRSVRTREDSS
jgi:hypothetical protein